ncbi:MAG: zinc ribbon domain-containing protein [Candidatus Poseidoniaceae archaeon]|jgi:hypothetical protein|nr:zinc ribbon domain-containing protein [Candidatus Poseidoniaceae archaeon]
MVVQVRNPGSGSSGGGVSLLILGVFFLIIGILIPPLACVGLIMLVIGITTLASSGEGGKSIIVQQSPVYLPQIQPPVQRPKQGGPIYVNSVQEGEALLRQQQIHRQQAQKENYQQQQIKIQKAKNLEEARDFDGAAKAYQEAGLYAEAGRIRQGFLEQNQPVVQIGQVGDTVLNDSVMISETSNKSCNNCGKISEDGWKICPHCSNPL